MFKRISFFIFFYLFINQFSFSQESPIKDFGWLEFGSFRFGPVEHDRGYGVDLSAKFKHNRTLFTLQYRSFHEKQYTSEFFTTYRIEEYNAINPMIGITNAKCNFGHVSASGGIGVFWGERNINYTTKPFTSISIPIELETIVNIKPFIGLGLRLFGNINSEFSFIGFGMSLQLGLLKSKMF